MNEQRHVKTIFSSFLYLISFLLLLEWIYPLKEVANTGTTLFIIFITLSFVLYLTNTPLWIHFVIKMVYILFAIQLLFYDTGLFQIGWFFELLKDIVLNIQFLFSMEWAELTNPFRSLLFFVLLWMITYLLRYWLMVRKSILLFFVMTIVYISVLDTFTPFRGSNAIVRSVIFGFSLLGLLFFQRFMEKERIGNSKRIMSKWVIPLSVMVIASTLFAFIAPKAAPIWPDPVPYLKGYAKGASKNGNSSGISQAGYRADDSRLGGPFVMNDEVVFRVQAESRQYWRIETKDVYTGKGWTTSEGPSIRTYPIGKDILLSTNGSIGPNQRKVQASITMEKLNSNIVYPYGIMNIYPSEFKEGSLVVDNTLEKVSVVQNSDTKEVKKYVITYQVPEYSIKKMSEPPDESYQVDQRYTQLPDRLPERVRNLAQEITRDKKNQYEKTKAVESYFSSGQFTYDRENVPIPSENQDYVDQFLFETRRGYCDNFSTSMVTLLRSVGIPARWAKGYTSGDFEGTVDATYNTYKITNNDAHSWVEVFFPNVGWVPFEPTIGFTNNSVFTNDVDRSTPAASTTDEDVRKRDEVNKPQQDEQTNAPKDQSREFSIRSIWNNTVDSLQKHWLFVTFIVLLFCLVMVWMYIKRTKWLPFLLVWRYRMAKGPETFTKAYLSLLKQLGRYGLKKQESQTLRDFAKHVDSFFDTASMRELTEKYERTIYRGQTSDDDWQKSRKLWENLIKKTTG